MAGSIELQRSDDALADLNRFAAFLQERSPELAAIVADAIIARTLEPAITRRGRATTSSAMMGLQDLRLIRKRTTDYGIVALRVESAPIERVMTPEISTVGDWSNCTLPCGPRWGRQIIATTP